MPTARERLSGVVLGTHVYCIGGCGERDLLSVVEGFDAESGEWTTLAPMPSNRSIGLAPK